MGVLKVCWRRVEAGGGRKSGYHGTALEHPGLENDSSWSVHSELSNSLPHGPASSVQLAEVSIWKDV